MRPRSAFGLRGRLLLAVTATLGLVIAALTAAFNIVLAERLDGQAKGLLEARASAELAALTVSHGRILLPEAPDQQSPDSLIWVFQGGVALERPQRSALADASAVSLARRALARRAPASEDLPALDSRLYALPVTAAGRRVGAVVAGLPLAAYTQTRRTALVGSVLLALAAFIAVVFAVRWMVARALRPVAQMTRQAAEWSEHDLERRFSQGPPHDEITQLAFTLDGLLARLAASLRHEQRLSAELSHELRTPLANIAAEAQYALRNTAQTADGEAALRRILDGTRRMSATLDTLIAAARGELDPHRATSDAGACVRAVAAACARLAAQHAVHVSVAAPQDPPRVAVEQQLVERILTPVVENACRHAKRTVRLTVDRGDNTVRFAVEDDGLGIPEEHREAIFEAGRRLPAAHATAAALPGAGLGLALSRRLARTAGGDVRAEQHSGGARLTIELPAAGSISPHSASGSDGDATRARVRPIARVL